MSIARVVCNEYFFCSENSSYLKYNIVYNKTTRIVYMCVRINFSVMFMTYFYLKLIVYNRSFYCIESCDIVAESKQLKLMKK